MVLKFSTLTFGLQRLLNICPLVIHSITQFAMSMIRNRRKRKLGSKSANKFYPVWDRLAVLTKELMLPTRKAVMELLSENPYKGQLHKI